MAERQPDQFTFRELVQNLQSFLRYMLSKWRIFLGAIFLSCLCFVPYNYLKPKVYSASTSFVLQNAESGLNEISSLASLAGVNLGGLAESSDLFQIDNIQELYRSHKMIAATLLSQADFPEGKSLLIDRYIDQRKYRRKWSDELNSLEFKRELFGKSRLQDSLLLEFTDDIRKSTLGVSKPSRKLTILNININDEDPYFAKAFNEKLVENVSHFYKSTMTEKSGKNLTILQNQADSVKLVLDNLMLELAEIQEGAPNRNPLYKKTLVQEQKLMIDMAASSAIYETVVTNLELAKIAHRNNTPLIQIIDEPILPLPNSRWKLAKTLIYAIALGLVIAFISLSFIRFYQLAITQH